jgi:hypothetical protein
VLLAVSRVSCFVSCLAPRVSCRVSCLVSLAVSRVSCLVKPAVHFSPPTSDAPDTPAVQVKSLFSRAPPLPNLGFDGQTPMVKPGGSCLPESDTRNHAQVALTLDDECHPQEALGGGRGPGSTDRIALHPGQRGLLYAKRSEDCCTQRAERIAVQTEQGGLLYKQSRCANSQPRMSVKRRPGRARRGGAPPVARTHDDESN